MKICRTLRRRGLALFLALTMCLGMLPVSVLAAESDPGQNQIVTAEQEASKASDIPTRVQAFRDAVANIPTLDDITAGNAAEVANCLYHGDVSEAYYAMKSNERKGEDAREAMKVYAAAVDKVNELLGNVSVTKLPDGFYTPGKDIEFYRGMAELKPMGKDYSPVPTRIVLKEGESKTILFSTNRPDNWNYGAAIAFFCHDNDSYDGTGFNIIMKEYFVLPARPTWARELFSMSFDETFPEGNYTFVLAYQHQEVDEPSDEDMNAATTPEEFEKLFTDYIEFTIVKEPKERYTVRYTDGVGGAVFADQETSNLKKGDGTPKFNADDGGSDQPTRDKYIFAGWKLTSVVPNRDGVQDTVAAEDANDSNEIIYTAQWKEDLVVPPVVKVTGGHTTPYNGREQALPEDKVTVTVDGVKTEEFTIGHYKDENGEIVTPKDAGEYTAVIKKDGEEIGRVTFTIEPRPLTIRTASDSKTYDGSPLTKTDDVTFIGLVDGEIVSVTVTGSQTSVGSSDNTYTVDWENSTAKPGNYTITPDYGTLTVNERSEPDPKPDPTPDPKPDPKPDDPKPDNPKPDNPKPDPVQPGISDRPIDPGTGMVPYDPTVILDDLVPLAAPYLNVTDHFAYIVGYSDGMVKPQANITRGEVATIFFRLMLDEYRRENWATENPFTDVGPELWCSNAISTCAKAGIIQGYPDGTFRPNDTITRAEFAAIAARFVSDDVPGYDYFTDMDGHWAQIPVARAVMAGWIKGDGRTFRPQDKMTRAETVTLVNRMINRFPDKEHLLEDMIHWPDNPVDAWYYEDIQEATNSHAYDLAELAFMEVWTYLLTNRDWAALEGEWADAASAPGGEVAPDLQEGYSGKQNDPELSAAPS